MQELNPVAGKSFTAPLPTGTRLWLDMDVTGSPPESAAASAAGTQPAPSTSSGQATAPAGLSVNGRQTMLLEAVNADPVDLDKLRRALAVVGNAELQFVKGPLESQPDQKGLPPGVWAYATGGKWGLAFSDGLNRTQRGPPPQDWIDRLTGPRKDGYKLRAPGCSLRPRRKS